MKPVSETHEYREAFQYLRLLAAEGLRQRMENCVECLAGKSQTPSMCEKLSPWLGLLVQNGKIKFSIRRHMGHDITIKRFEDVFLLFIIQILLITFLSRVFA